MSTKQKIYNIVICVLSVVSVIIAVIDFTIGLTRVLLFFDYIIYGIFVTDYAIRLMLAGRKKTFIKDNILDLIAIIPFSSALRIFRTAKIFRATKLLKITKLLRVGAVSARGLSKIKTFLNTNNFKYVLIIAASSIIVSSLFMTYFEQMSFQDSLWWSFVTATTVGYGDLSPATSAGRIIASLLMLVGIGLIGSLTSSITSFFLDNSTNDECSSDKIEMVLTLYDKLSPREKQTFAKAINKH